MFLAGIKDHQLKSNSPSTLVCPKCERKGTTHIEVIGMYKHLAQIPFLGAKKKGRSECKRCGHVMEVPQMPDLIRLAYYELKETVRTPLWFYAGLSTIKTLVLIKIFSRYF